MFIYRLNRCQQCWCTPEYAPATSCIFEQHQHFYLQSSVQYFKYYNVHRICGRSASFKTENKHCRLSVVCIFHTTGVDFSPRKYKNGKSTDMSPHELQSVFRMSILSSLIRMSCGWQNTWRSACSIVSYGQGRADTSTWSVRWVCTQVVMHHHMMHCKTDKHPYIGRYEVNIYRERSAVGNWIQNCLWKFIFFPKLTIIQVFHAV